MLNFALYTWLLRNDKQWFNSNSPPRRRLVDGYYVVDWHARDRSLAAQVITAALAIKNMPGRARRVSKSGIARELAAASQFTIQLEKLPLTRLALNGMLENRDQFAHRRLRRAVERLVSLRQRPNQSTLACAAGISYCTTSPSLRESDRQGSFGSRISD